MSEAGKRNAVTLFDGIKRLDGAASSGNARMMILENRVATLEGEIREIRSLLGATLQAVKGPGPTAR